MTNLKVAFSSFWPEWQYEHMFITDALSKHFDVEVVEDKPDVVFYSIFGQDHLKYKKAKKILFLAENIRNTYNPTIRANIGKAIEAADYTISFDPHSDRNYRLPLWQVYLLNDRKLLQKLMSDDRAVGLPLKWCAFIVSNGANIFRNSLYMSLNEYKKVSSYGKLYMNDKSLIEASEGRYWRDAKLDFFESKKHKFMFAGENSLYKYYCTEKLMDAYLCGSVPIYWGDPKVNEDWNERAFINVTNKTIDEVIDVDKDESRYRDMLNELIFSQEQMDRHLSNMMGFEEWLIDKIR